MVDDRTLRSDAARWRYAADRLARSIAGDALRQSLARMEEFVGGTGGAISIAKDGSLAVARTTAHAVGSRHPSDGRRPGIRR